MGSFAASTATVLAASVILLPLGTAPTRAQTDEVLGVTPGDVDITLSAAGEVTLTDRAGGVGGTSSGGDDADSGDIITTVTGEAAALANGAHTNLAGTYSASYDQYLSQSSRSGFRQTMLAAGTHEAIEDHLFFDVSSSLATRFTGVGAASATDRAGVGNQTQTLSWSLGPTWRQRVAGPFANLGVSYRFAGTTFFSASSGDVDDNDRPDDGIIHTANIGLTSGREFSRVHWALNGSWQTQTDSNEDGETGKRSVEASTEYRINRQYGLLGSVGYDDVELADQSEGVTSESDLSGPFWTVGLRFNPSERTDMRAEYGDRYGEPYYRALVNWRITERTSVNASYTTEVVTLQEALVNRLQFTPTTLGELIAADRARNCALADPATLSFLCDQTSLVDATTRTETARIGASTQRERTTYAVNATLTKRDFTRSGEEDTTLGVNGAILHQLTPQTSGLLSVSYTTGDDTITGSEAAGLTTSDGTTSLRGSLRLSHQFADDLSGSLSYSHLRRDEESDSGASSENALVARIQVTF